jgi:His-Xaa-Ser system radical SAM maturase HxsC
MQLWANIAKTADSEPFIARIGETDSKNCCEEILLVRGDEPVLQSGFKCILRLGTAQRGEIEIPQALEYLCAGDIIRVNRRGGEIRVLYRRDSPHNILFFTERCNSRCVMCSQPPRTYDDSHLLDEILEAIPLMSLDTRELCITGGEPTLVGNKFLEILLAIKQSLPQTSVHVLTNGRLCSLNFARNVAAIAHRDLMFGIPLYSDIASKHDFVVQAKGAFDQTLRGVMNLERFSQRVEIRFVIHKQTFERLPQTARFIARNIPFVEQVALMGLEMMGYAKTNIDALWIDPVDYQNELRAAVKELSQSGIKTVIYNHQLCVLEKELWPFARKSISDWKNVYLPECSQCGRRNQCGGFFASATFRRSRSIRPFSSAAAVTGCFEDGAFEEGID